MITRDPLASENKLGIISDVTKKETKLNLLLFLL